MAKRVYSKLMPVAAIAASAIMLTSFQNCSPSSFQSDVSFEKTTNALEIEIPDPGSSPVPTPEPTPYPETPDMSPPGPSPVPPGPTPELPEEQPLPPPPVAVPPGEDDGKKAALCKKIEIADVVVNVDTIAMNSSTFTMDGPGSLSLMSLEDGMTIQVTEAMSVSQIRLVLAAEGNMIVGANDETYPLKTPSAQQSGLKLNMTGSHTLEPGKTYTLKAVFDPETQIVFAGKKCLLKPVIRVIELK